MTTRVAEGSVLSGKYRVERMLARGGMGSVWVAQHLQLDAPVAIKFIDPEFAMNPEARTRFAREAKAAARLRTPYVVQIYDHGVDGDTPYIVMELLEGEDLRARLRKTRRLPLGKSLEILTHVAKGLDRAHELGIIHRDLKPGNLFIARTVDGEVTKILDFGVAKVARTEVVPGDGTTTNQLVGSLDYMSPEQARGVGIDRRSDLWSLGVILFRCVTGAKPFTAPAVGDLLLTICTAPVPKPSSVAPDLSAGVDAFFERALTRDPEVRFQRASEMADAFAAAIGEPARAKPPVEVTAPTEGAEDAHASISARGSSSNEAVDASSLEPASSPNAGTLRGGSSGPRVAPPSPSRSILWGALAVGGVVAAVIVAARGVGTAPEAAAPSSGASVTTDATAAALHSPPPAATPVVEPATEPAAASAVPSASAPAPIPVARSRPSAEPAVAPARPASPPAKKAAAATSNPPPAPPKKKWGFEP